MKDACRTCPRSVLENANIVLCKYTPVDLCTQQPRYPLQHHPICISGFITQPVRENNVEQSGRVCKKERSVLVYICRPSSIMRAQQLGYRTFFLIPTPSEAIVPGYIVADI